jgi:hypothetical protein
MSSLEEKTMEKNGLVKIMMREGYMIISKEILEKSKKYLDFFKNKNDDEIFYINHDKETMNEMLDVLSGYKNHKLAQRL